MRQYILEVEYIVVVDSEETDAETVSSNFVARLGELAPTDSHILSMSVTVLPIPELREASN